MRAGEEIKERYILEEEASRGGMGVVWKGWDLATEAPVAVKILTELAPDDVRRFQREAAILAELQLPGVVRYIDHGTTENGNHYLIMEWLDGQTVRQQLELAGLTQREATTLVATICAILEPLHDRGVVHRDLKPENLVFSTSLDQVKVIDFGLARNTGEPTRITGTGVTLGTPGYMAPEQVRAEREITAATDVFALGCILYECLTGFPAFAGENLIAVQSKILFAEPPPLRTLAPRAPDALETLLGQMLAKAPGKRPSDTRVVRAALAAIGEVDDDVRRRGGSGTVPTAQLRDARHLGLVMARGSQAVHRETEIDDAVAPYGGRLELFDDGSVVVVFPRAVAAEVAERAARCALKLRPLLPAVPMVVITGHGPIEELIDRAAISVDEGARVELFEDHAATPGIATDAPTADLLRARFRLKQTALGWHLVSEGA